MQGAALDEVAAVPGVIVAAAAALMISANPTLTGARVREILTATADSLTPSGGWSRFTGWGRLNAYAAVRAARRG